MSVILNRSRNNSPPKEFAEKKLPKLLELYTNWYDGDIPAAKVALIQDIIEFGDQDEVSKWHAGILQAIKAGNG
jgi:hypothetical protein